MYGRSLSGNREISGSVAEPVEPRPGTKGNAEQQSTLRTQGRERVTQALGRARLAARQRKKEQFTALLHHINVDTLREREPGDLWIGGGAGGAKAGDQGERGTAKHTPDTGPGTCDPGARPRTASRKAEEEGTVHRAPPPYQCRYAPGAGTGRSLDRWRSRWSQGRGPRGTRNSKAHSGHRAGNV